MNKELPKVYANKIEKPLTNNDSYSYNGNVKKADDRKADNVERKETKNIIENLKEKDVVLLENTSILQLKPKVCCYNNERRRKYL